MSPRRVMITGMGSVTPFGCGVPALWESLVGGQSAVRSCPTLSGVKGLRTTVAACVPELDAQRIDRKKRRYMSKMSIYATLAALEAVEMAGLTPDQLHHPRTGVCIGSTTGSTMETETLFLDVLKDRSIENMKSTHFFKIMNSSCATNLSQALGIHGWLLAPSAACATGTVAVGLGAETIASGKQDVMICGGADEMHMVTVAVFDSLEASSRLYNETPDKTPRPFDRDRDGIVCGEGAGLVVLESLEHAQARQANILGEVRGYAINSTPDEIADPQPPSMIQCMRQALEEAHFRPEDMGYLNAHATGTIRGDSAECRAIEEVFGRNLPVSSLKGHLGHTMAACGALEIIATLLMMRDSLLLPTRNLVEPDEVCGRLNLLKNIERRPLKAAISNNFALGGVNSAIVITGRPTCDG
jgi:3-oxoacyl-[acyl-carrier-protein] synthase II